MALTKIFPVQENEHQMDFEISDDQLIEKLAKKSFSIIDCDKDGYISGEDFYKLVRVITKGMHSKQLPDKEECLYAFFSINWDLGSKISIGQWTFFVKQFIQSIEAKNEDDEQELRDMLSSKENKSFSRRGTSIQETKRFL